MYVLFYKEVYNMKLQISFDLVDLDKAIDIASKVAKYADIIEIGTLLLYKYGIKAVADFRKKLPKESLLADSKIIDRGKDAANIIFDAGADWVTVMSGTSKDVIHAVATAAHELNKKVMLDLVDSSSPGQSALEAKSFGIDAILFHQTYDEKQTLLFLDKWDMVKGNTQLPIFISARINRDTIEKILELKPDGVVIGKSITGAINPEEEAKFFYEACFGKQID